MALFKCKNCGGDVEPYGDGVTGKCLYCGSVQTLPKEADERISQLLNRANDFRLNSDFDRAIFEYEKVLELDETEPEAHWGLFLSKYGVEYVKDTMTQLYKPTLHRISSVSVYDDVDYQATLRYASVGASVQYKEDAEHIEMVMKELLLLSANQEPYDIFLSYKELDDVTRVRTDDSYLAHDLYNELTAQGYKVFFAPKSLIGVALYEPKIYSAIISSKIMIVLGTKPEYLEGVWVKNEWSRFAEAIENGEDKVLIPVFKNMEASQLPNRIAKYQAYNMASMTFLPSLFDAIAKSVKRDSRIDFDKNSSAEAAFVERGFLALEDREFSQADSFFEKALNINPHNPQVYFGKLMVEMRINKKEQILTSSKPLGTYKSFEKAVRFADQQLKTVLLQYEEKVQYTLDEQEYNKAMAFILRNNPSQGDYERAAEIFKSITRFEDAKEKEALCLERIDGIKKERILSEAKSKMTGEFIPDYEEAIELFKSISGWKDADEQIPACEKKIKELEEKRVAELKERERKAEEERIEKERKAEEARKEVEKTKKMVKKAFLITLVVGSLILAITLLMSCVIIPNGKYNDAVALMDEGKYEEAISAFEALNGHKDSDEKIEECNEAILDKRYNEALALIDEGKKVEAMQLFSALDGHKDSVAHISSILKDISVRETISADSYHTVCLKSNGTVVSTKFIKDTKFYAGGCDVKDWKDIVAISAGATHTVGLKSDGTVVASDDSSNTFNQCDVSEWKDIVAISTAARHTIGLKSDGTVVATELKASGYVTDSGQCDVSEWKDIIAISAGGYHTVGLKSDGTVVATGSNNFGQCDVSEWKDIVAISAGEYHTIGLKSDGTVVATEFKNATYIKHQGQCDVSEWKDIIGISAGQWHTVGLKSDGTVVAVGANSTGRCNVEEWKDIVAISAGDYHTIGLKSDGTVVATKYIETEETLEYSGQCDVSGWKNIKVPGKK